MNIKELRQSTNMTQKEFGEYFGISPRTIQNWESERRTPPQYVVELIKYKIKKERLGMLRLKLSEESQKELLVEGDLRQIIGYLESNYDDLFSWIWEDKNINPEVSQPERPDFTEIKDLQDLEIELEKVDLDWWEITVEEEMKMKTMFNQDNIKILSNESGGVVEYDYEYFREGFEEWCEEYDCNLPDVEELRQYIVESGYRRVEIRTEE